MSRRIRVHCSIDPLAAGLLLAACLVSGGPARGQQTGDPSVQPAAEPSSQGTDPLLDDQRSDVPGVEGFGVRARSDGRTTTLTLGGRVGVGVGGGGVVPGYRIGGRTYVRSAGGQGYVVVLRESDRAIVGRYARVPSLNRQPPAELEPELPEFGDLPSLARAEAHLIFGELGAALAALGEHDARRRAMEEAQGQDEPSGLGHVDSAAGASSRSAVEASARSLVGEQAWTDRLRAVAVMRGEDADAGLALLARVYAADPLLAGAAIPEEFFASDRQIRDLLRRAVRAAYRPGTPAWSGTSSLDRWVAVLAMMQAEGRVQGARRLVDRLLDPSRSPLGVMDQRSRAVLGAWALVFGPAGDSPAGDDPEESDADADG